MIVVGGAACTNQVLLKLAAAASGRRADYGGWWCRPSVWCCWCVILANPAWLAPGAEGCRSVGDPPMAVRRAPPPGAGDRQQAAATDPPSFFCDIRGEEATQIDRLSAWLSDREFATNSCLRQQLLFCAAVRGRPLSSIMSAGIYFSSSSRCAAVTLLLAIAAGAAVRTPWTFAAAAALPPPAATAGPSTAVACPDCGKVGVTAPDESGASVSVVASSLGLPAVVDNKEDILGVLPQRQVCDFFLPSQDAPPPPSSSCLLAVVAALRNVRVLSRQAPVEFQYLLFFASTAAKSQQQHKEHHYFCDTHDQHVSADLSLIVLRPFFSSIIQAPLAEFMNRALQATGISELLEHRDQGTLPAGIAATSDDHSANNLTTPPQHSDSSQPQGAEGGNWTLFAPTGDAWQRFLRHSSSRKTEDDLLKDPNLKALLLHHLAEGVFDPQARSSAAGRQRASSRCCCCPACCHRLAGATARGLCGDDHCCFGSGGGG